MSDQFPTREEIAAFRQEHLGRLFLRAHRAFSERALLKFQEREYDWLRPMHLTLIAQIDLDGTNVTSLASRIGVTKQAVSQMLDELESRGYVERTVDPANRRAAIVTFTEAGVRLLHDAYQIKQEIEAEYIAVLGEDGFNQLRSLLFRLLESIE